MDTAVAPNLTFMRVHPPECRQYEFRDMHLHPHGCQIDLNRHEWAETRGVRGSMVYWGTFLLFTRLTEVVTAAVILTSK